MLEPKDFYNSSVSGDPVPIKYIDFPDIKPDISIDNALKHNDVKRYKVDTIKDPYGAKFSY